MLHAPIFLSVSFAGPSSNATQSADGYIASLLQFSSSLSAFDLFLYTDLSPLMSLNGHLSRSHCWCGRLLAGPVRSGHSCGPAGKSICRMAYSFHVFTASVQIRCAGHRTKTSAEQRQYPPKGYERCSQLRNVGSKTEPLIFLSSHKPEIFSVGWKA